MDDTFAERIKVLQAESERIKQYLRTLPPEAWHQPSACTGWEVSDVVAHLIGVAETYAGSVSRGVQGDASPPPGRPPAGSSSASLAAESIAQRSIAMRQRLGEQLLATYEAANDHLNQLLADLRPEQRGLPCYHPGGIVPARRFIDLRLKELAMHDWDIRAGRDPRAPVSVPSFPSLMDVITESIASGSLRWGFWAGPKLSTPVRYRCDVTGPVPCQTDIVVEGDQVRMETSGETPAQVHFRCDTATFVLLVYGRLTPEAAVADGRLVVQGDNALAVDFGRWFKGI